MNLILVDSLCHKQILRKTDRRAVQISNILGDQSSAELFVGCTEGRAIGKAEVLIDVSGDVELRIEWSESQKEVDSTSGTGYISLLIPFCRPQTCRKVLRSAASLGISRLHFFHADKSDKGYSESSLWKNGEWREMLLEGVEQAFDPMLPELELTKSGLSDTLAQVKLLYSNYDLCGIALDNYEAKLELQRAVRTGANVVHIIAVGPERGWSRGERNALRDANFQLAHMGHRVMRTEIAVTAAASVISSASGAWSGGDTLQFLKSKGIEQRNPEE